ncbi:hypothetical protein PSPO01_00970, partial [Paraphaeosphaeria sporulosa]
SNPRATLSIALIDSSSRFLTEPTEFATFSVFTILCLLPNFRELALHPGFADTPSSPITYGIVFSARQLFCYRPLDGTYSLPCRPLEKDGTLLPCQTETDDHFVNLKFIRQFLELPGLKNVYFTSGYAISKTPSIWKQGLSTAMHMVYIALQLRRRELYSVCINSNGLDVLSNALKTSWIWRIWRRIMLPPRIPSVKSHPKPEYTYAIPRLVHGLANI